MNSIGARFFTYFQISFAICLLWLSLFIGILGVLTKQFQLPPASTWTQAIANLGSIEAPIVLISDEHTNQIALLEAKDYLGGAGFVIATLTEKQAIPKNTRLVIVLPGTQREVPIKPDPSRFHDFRSAPFLDFVDILHSWPRPNTSWTDKYSGHLRTLGLLALTIAFVSIWLKFILPPLRSAWMR